MTQIILLKTSFSLLLLSVWTVVFYSNRWLRGKLFCFRSECAIPRGRCGASEGAGGLRPDQPGLPHGRHTRPSPGGGQDQGNCTYLLAGCGQTSLAYLTGATHGLHQEADRIKVSCYLLAGRLRPDQPGLPHRRYTRPPPGGGQDQG